MICPEKVNTENRTSKYSAWLNFISKSDYFWCSCWWAGVFVLFVLSYLAAPISDPDFFWHLNTGEWIWDNSRLPDKDPFTTLSGPLDFRQKFILSSYWLSQLFYYLVYSLSGFYGFFAIRIVLVAVLVFALIKNTKGSLLLNSLVVSCFLVAFVCQYHIERPQVFSFISFAILLFLLERLSIPDNRPSKTAILGVPVLMMIWSNLHAGVLLGQILCVAALFNITLRYLTKKVSRYSFFIGSTTLLTAICLALVNPNGLHWPELLRELINPAYKIFTETNIEYQSIYAITTEYDLEIYLYYPISLLFVVFGLVRKCKHEGLLNNIAAILLLCAFTYFSFKHVRYLGFLGIFSLPMIAYGINAIEKRFAVTLLVICFVTCVAVTPAHLTNIQRLSKTGMVSSVFPLGAVEYVKKSGLHGNVFNEYSEGGYLSWALGPKHKIFVDGRTLDVERYMYWGLLFSELEKAQRGPDNRRSAYAKVEKLMTRIATKYETDYVILPRIFEGKSFVLTEFVDRSRKWKKVYEDKTSSVFVKN